MGFGDFYPVTHFGRFIVMLACFWGMFLISQFVYTMETSSAFTFAEQKAFDLLHRLQKKNSLKREAGLLIKAWWRLKLGYSQERKEEYQK